MASLQPCTLIGCTNDGNLASYIGAYSLNGVLHYSNIVLVVPIPGGLPSQTITIPAGTISIPSTPGATVLSYQGCQSTVTRSVPPGSTTAQIAAIAAEIIAAIAQQTAACTAQTARVTSSPPVFTNDAISSGCSDGSQLSICATPTYPRGLSFDTTGVGFIHIQAGIFSGASKAQANLQAVNYINAFLAANLLSGNFSCGVPCPASCGDVPTSPSDMTWTNSCPCGGSPCPYDEDDSSGSIHTSATATGNAGSFSCFANANEPSVCSGFCLDSQICNPTASDKQISFHFTGSYPPTDPNTNSDLSVSVNGVGVQVWDGTTFNNPAVLVVPAGQTVAIEIAGTACSNAVGAGITMAGGFTVALS
jgi:hypothetical protein